MLHVIGDDPEMGIDMLVILHIVFMAGGGDENRVQVQNLYAEGLQIVQLVQNALQVPAVKGPDVRVRGERGPVGDVLRMADGIIVFVVGHVIGGIPVTETFRKNLILHGSFRPFRNMKAGLKAEGIRRIVFRESVFHGAASVFVVGNADPVRAFDQETVHDLGRVADNAGLIEIKEIIGAFLFHQRADFQGFREENDPFGASFRDPDPDIDRVADVRLGGKTVKRRFIAENRGENLLTEGHKTSSSEIMGKSYNNAGKSARNQRTISPGRKPAGRGSSSTKRKSPSRRTGRKAS